MVAVGRGVVIVVGQGCSLTGKVGVALFRLSEVISRLGTLAWLQELYQTLKAMMHDYRQRAIQK